MTRQWNRNPLQNVRHMRDQREANNEPEHTPRRPRRWERATTTGRIVVEMGADTGDFTAAIGRVRQQLANIDFDVLETRIMDTALQLGGDVSEFMRTFQGAMTEERARQMRDEFIRAYGGNLRGVASLHDCYFTYRVPTHPWSKKAGQELPKARKLPRSVAGQWVTQVYGALGHVEVIPFANGPQLPFIPYLPPQRRTYAKRTNRREPRTQGFTILKGRRAGLTAIDSLPFWNLGEGESRTIRFFDPV